MTDIGFIGTGTMGRPMATCLAGAGFGLVLHDIDAAGAQAFAATLAQARVAETPRDVAAACDIVVTMLPTGADVRAVTMETDGIAAGLAQGGVLIDMSSSEPADTAALATELGEMDFHMIDAPVSGGRAKAEDGTLTLMVGGDDAVITRCLPVLEAMGSQIFRTGRTGSGHAAKALNNLMNAAGLLIAGEALLTGARFGIAPETLRAVIDASTGMNHAIRNKMRQHVFSRGFASGFTLDLMVKDVATALALAGDTGTPAPVSALCLEQWRAAQAALGTGHDHTEIVRWQERVANTELADSSVA